MPLRKDNIIIYNDFDYVEGGASKVAIDQANILASRNHKVTFIYSDSRHKVDENQLFHEDIEKICLNVKFRENKLLRMFYIFFNLKLISKLKLILKKFDPKNTFIIINNYNKIFGFSIFFPIMQYRSLMIMHSYQFVCPSGFFFNERTNKSCKLIPNSFSCIKSQCQKNPIIKYAFHLRNLIERILVKRSKNLYLAATSETSSITNQLAPSNNQQFILNNYLPQKFYSRVRVEFNDYYLFYGRPGPEKGLDLVLKAFNRKPFKLAIAGADPDFIYSQINSNHKKFIKVFGWINSDYSYDIFKSCKAMFFLSIMTETFGITAYEAARAGLPIIKLDHFNEKPFKVGITCYQVKDSVSDLQEIINSIDKNTLHNKNISINLHKEFNKNFNITENNYYMRLTQILDELPNDE